MRLTEFLFPKSLKRARVVKWWWAASTPRWSVWRERASCRQKWVSERPSVADGPSATSALPKTACVRFATCEVRSLSYGKVFMRCKEEHDERLTSAYLGNEVVR